MENSFETLIHLLTRIADSVEIIAQSSSPKRRRVRGITAIRTLSDIAVSFIKDHQDRLTEYLIDQQRWTITNVSGECAGKLQREGEYDFNYAPGWSLVVPRDLFRLYALNVGISQTHLKQMMVKQTSRRLRLVKNGRAISCWIIPMVQGAYTPRGNA
jgi:hypothetical protein